MSTLLPSTNVTSTFISIPLNDDAINEATEGFILVMTVETTTAADATNLQIGDDESLGSINDNDSKYQ